MGAMEPGPAKRTRASMKLNQGLSGLSIGKTASSKRQKLEEPQRPASHEDPYGAEVLATMQGRELAHARPTLLLDKSSADQRATVLRKLPS